MQEESVGRTSEMSKADQTDSIDADTTETSSASHQVMFQSEVFLFVFFFKVRLSSDLGALF